MTDSVDTMDDSIGTGDNCTKVRLHLLKDKMKELEYVEHVHGLI